jgi:beta-galactosidase
MEPGGGGLSIPRPSKTPANPAALAAAQFSQQFMTLKCRQMVRAFRSHPSLIQYTLQNEFDGDLKNPITFAILELMHGEDPSRCVVLDDGFTPKPQAQAWYAPYDDNIHRSDREQFGGWWNNHQGADDQWYDRLYKDPTNFTYRKPLDGVLVEWGEMEGCAVADNHPLMIHQIETKQFGGSGSSYDLVDHQQIAVAYDRFFDRWGFRKAFPSSETFFQSLGNKCYESWQQYIDNVRICDQIDFCAISGWESTSIENHSGIVDNLRNFKANPDLIAGSLLPLRPVAKQHQLTVSKGQPAVFDLYLLNDTGETPKGKLTLAMIDPKNNRTTLASLDAPPVIKDQFSYLLQAEFTTPALQLPGIHRFIFRSDAAPLDSFTREVWVVDPVSTVSKPLKVGINGVTGSLSKQLAAMPGVQVEPFNAGHVYDVIVASGIVPGSKLDRQIGSETGTESDKSSPVTSAPGCIPDEVLAAVRSGTPLLAAVPDDFLADGVARQIAALGAFTYSGQVGDTRAPWMGNWNFVREHPTFDGLPTDRVMSVHYQSSGKHSNGLLIERAPNVPDPEVIMGYSRDHDRRVGAASFLCYVGSTPVLMHRAPEFVAPIQARWLINTLNYLHDKKPKTKHST